MGKLRIFQMVRLEKKSSILILCKKKIQCEQNTADDAAESALSVVSLNLKKRGVHVKLFKATLKALHLPKIFLLNPVYVFS